MERVGQLNILRRYPVKSMAGEAKQAVHDAFHALRFVPEFLQALGKFFFLNLFNEQFRIAENAGEGIVEFVGHTGDQLAERGEFFRAYELVMQARVFDGHGEVGGQHFELDHLGGVGQGSVLRAE